MSNRVTIRSRLDTNKEEITREYNSGISTTKLAIKYKCNCGTIYLALKEWGVITERRLDKFNTFEDYKDECIRLFNEGMTVSDISREVNISVPVLCKHLKRLGYDTSRFSKLRDDPIKNHTSEIIRLYTEEKLSTGKIAKIYKCGQPSVLRLLWANNIETRDNTIYEVNEEYLDSIDTFAKAYIIGLLYSDGNNRGDGIRWRMADLDILEKVRNEFEYTGPIVLIPKQTERHKDQYELFVSRKRLSDRATELGCPPNKTHIITFPSGDQVPKRWIPAFILGVFDGDGSLWRNGGNSYAFSITGTIPLLRGIADYLEPIIGHEFRWYCRHPERNNNISSIYMGSNGRVAKILDFLYSEATIHLDRKYERYLELKEHLKSK